VIGYQTCGYRPIEDAMEWDCKQIWVGVRAARSRKFSGRKLKGAYA
jgi:hypothetical protein